DLEYRRRRGEQPTPDEYQRRFPADDALIKQCFREMAPPTPCPPVNDLTVTYLVVTIDEDAKPFVGDSGHEQLQAAFAPASVLHERYVLEGELGRGGMGQVYLARDSRLDRPVALKVIRQDCLPGGPVQPDRAQAAFAEEARLGANLTHPAIATVFDFGFHQ